MFSFLKNVAASLQKNSNARPSACGPRRASLSLQCLEDRQLLSASPLMAMVAPLYSDVVQVQPMMTHDRLVSAVDSPATVSQSVSIEYKSPANFRNIGFTMIGENGSTHQLVIQAQGPGYGGTASFTGVWDGLKGSGAAVSGWLGVDGSNTDISFSWGNHTFEGIISSAPGSYHIEGTVYINGIKGGPGFTVGDQATMVTDLTNVKFLMMSDSTGTTHTLKIEAEKNQYDGTATFTGKWDGGAAVTGILSYDVDGNITIVCNWGPGGNHEFDGTITNGLLGYEITGTVYVNGDPTIGPGYVYGYEQWF